MKNAKTSGITLIALIITIIVLLILAGVTINALTGSDSAPAKANEAEQKNDIGSAKDQISLTVVNAKTDAYDTAYVGNGISSTEAADSVGRAVIKAVAEQINTKSQYGKATVEITDFGTIANITNNATITISTRDFELTGTITLQDGILSWGEIEDNVPGIKIRNVPASLDKGSFVELGIKKNNVTGDVTWTSSKPTVATVDENTGKVTGVAAGTTIITASLTGTDYTAQCTITVVASKADKINDLIGKTVTYSANGVSDWKIFYADSASKEMFIITTNILYSSGAGSSATSGLATPLPSSGIPIEQSTVAGTMREGTYGEKWNSMWLTYNNGSTAVTTQERHKAAAYLCDTTKWEAYVAKKEDGTTPKIADSYAVGAPTLELFVASWNKVNIPKKITDVTPFGYSNIFSAEITDNIGRPTGEDIGLYKTSSSGSYWIASPEGGMGANYYMLYVECDTEMMKRSACNDTKIGFRPLVSIPLSNVQIDGNGNVSILNDAQLQQ